MVKSRVFHDVDFAAESLLKVGYQTAREEGCSSGTGFNQEVEVAVRTRLVAYERAKDFHARHTVAAGDVENPVAFSSLQLRQRHSKTMVSLIQGQTLSPGRRRPGFRAVNLEIVEQLTHSTPRVQNVPAQGGKTVACNNSCGNMGHFAKIGWKAWQQNQ